MARYKVVGPRHVFETAPGNIVDRELTPEQEKRLLRVHLKLIETEDAPEPAPAPKPRTRRKKTAPVQPESEE